MPHTINNVFPSFRKRNSVRKISAFTLIELLATIVIIGILATLSVATYGGYQTRAKEAKELAERSQNCTQTITSCVANGIDKCISFEKCLSGESVKSDIMDSNLQNYLATTIGKPWSAITQDDLNNFTEIVSLYGLSNINSAIGIGNLTSISELYLGIRYYSDGIPSDIGNLNNLNTLGMQNQNINSIPEIICNIKNLDTLDLIGNNLTTLPKCIDNFNKLKYLFIQNNNISSFPILINGGPSQFRMSGNPATCSDALAAGWTGACTE